MLLTFEARACCEGALTAQAQFLADIMQRSGYKCCRDPLDFLTVLTVRHACCFWLPFSRQPWLIWPHLTRVLDGTTHTHSHTHPFNGPFPGLPRWAGTRKVKPIWILLKQETVSDSGISWAICKSASRSRQITMPVPHHSSYFTGRMPFLPPNQQRQSTEGKGVVSCSCVFVQCLPYSKMANFLARSATATASCLCHARWYHCDTNDVDK